MLKERSEYPITIGLTGGIASGKSTVSHMLSEKGATIVDADSLAHTVYEPGKEGYTALIDVFGGGIVGIDKKINRKALGAIVFQDEELLHKLNEIVWPLTKAEVQRLQAENKQSGQPVVVVEAAMLLEAGWEDITDEVWIVKSSEMLRSNRLMTRNGLSKKDARARIQAVGEKDTTKADVVIVNTGDKEDLQKSVTHVWDEFKKRHGV